jgi:hypothetical protein
MGARTRANRFMFFPEFMEVVQKALRENVTVIPFVYDRKHDTGYYIEFDVRITKLGTLALPATRRPLTKKQFTDRVVRANARRIRTTKEPHR